MKNMKFGLLRLSKYVLHSASLLAILIASSSARANSYSFHDEPENIFIKIGSELLSDSVKIEVQCKINHPLIYKALVIDSVTNEAKVRGMPSDHRVRLWLDGRYAGQYIEFGDERLYRHKIRKLQASSVQAIEKEGESGRVDLYSDELLELPGLCKSKIERLVKESAAKSRETANSSGYSPMFNGANLIEARDFTVKYVRSADQYIGKYVWLGDSDYRVSKVSSRGVMFKPRLGGAYHIAILTKSSAQLGQKISDVTKAPLRLLGIEDYQTDLGTKTKVFIFEVVSL